MFLLDAKNYKNKKVILGLTLAAFGTNYVFMAGEKKADPKGIFIYQ